MRALSVRQPWASLIAGATADGTRKDVENRTWRQDRYRGPLLICASLRPDTTAEAVLAAQGLPMPTTAPLGVAVAIVDLVDIVWGHPSPWAWPDAWQWVLAHPRPVEPFPVKGQLGLFTVEWQRAR